MRDPHGKYLFGPDARRAYRVVDLFEQELCDYTGAPFAVAVNSCTNALLLSMTWERGQFTAPIELPRHTYIGVLQSVLNSGWGVRWTDEDWQGVGSPTYRLSPAAVVDSARHLWQGMYAWDVKGWPTLRGKFTCLSFHSAKQLPLGRGGAILTDNQEAAEWFRAARMDGRPPGENRAQFPGFHMPMSPDVAARGLDILSRWNDKGYSPPPLPHEDYPDLSLWYP